MDVKLNGYQIMWTRFKTWWHGNTDRSSRSKGTRRRRVLRASHSHFVRRGLCGIEHLEARAVMSATGYADFLVIVSPTALGTSPQSVPYQVSVVTFSTSQLGVPEIADSAWTIRAQQTLNLAPLPRNHSGAEGEGGGSGAEGEGGTDTGYLFSQGRSFLLTMSAASGSNAIGLGGALIIPLRGHLQSANVIQVVPLNIPTAILGPSTPGQVVGGVGASPGSAGPVSSPPGFEVAPWQPGSGTPGSVAPHTLVNVSTPAGLASLLARSTNSPSTSTHVNNVPQRDAGAETGLRKSDSELSSSSSGANRPSLSRAEGEQSSGLDDGEGSSWRSRTLRKDLFDADDFPADESESSEDEGGLIGLDAGWRPRNKAMPNHERGTTFENGVRVRPRSAIAESQKADRTANAVQAEHEIRVAESAVTANEDQVTVPADELQVSSDGGFIRLASYDPSWQQIMLASNYGQDGSSPRKLNSSALVRLQVEPGIGAYQALTVGGVADPNVSGESASPVESSSVSAESPAVGSGIPSDIEAGVSGTDSTPATVSYSTWISSILAAAAGSLLWYRRRKERDEQ